MCEKEKMKKEIRMIRMIVVMIVFMIMVGVVVCGYREERIERARYMEREIEGIVKGKHEGIKVEREGGKEYL